MSSSSVAGINTPAPAVLALVLAAGSAQRFGSDKRRALLSADTSLLAATLAQAQRNFSRVAVVLRVGDDPQQLGVPATVQVIYCANAALGMAHSLAAGVQALERESGCALAVLLGDMPWIAPNSLQRLSAAASAERIVFPLHAGVRGHPVIFGRQYWRELCLLRGDSGAKALLAAHADACCPIELDDPGVLRDVDTPAALCEPR